jgi:hypothetical protein
MHQLDVIGDLHEGALAFDKAEVVAAVPTVLPFDRPAVKAARIAAPLAFSREALKEGDALAIGELTRPCALRRARSTIGSRDDGIEVHAVVPLGSAKMSATVRSALRAARMSSR